MVHGLAAVDALVCNDAVTGGRLRTPGLGDDLEKVADFFCGRRCDEITEIARVAFGNHEQMRWRVRVRVAKDEDVLGAAHFLRGDLAAKDTAEDTGVAHGVAFGFMVLKLKVVSGLAVTPPIVDFAANETTECTSGIAGTRSWIIAFAAA